jgi:hypothetical protein
MTRTLAVLLLSILPLFFCAPQGLAYANVMPSAKIVQIEYPQRVLVNQRFSVNVTIQYVYPNWTIADLGIQDPEEIATLDCIRYYITGSDVKTYMFNLTAPPVEKTWHLEAITRYWFNYNWLLDDLDGRRSFWVDVTNRLAVVVKVPNERIHVRIDGREYTGDSGGIVRIEVQLGFHAIEVQSILQLTEDVRMLFSKWNDGFTLNSRKILVNKPIILEAIYTTQYRLMVDSPYEKCYGAGWYDVNSTANFTVPESVPARDLTWILGVRYRFEKWSGDSTSSNPTSSLLIDNPKKVSAIWRIDYNSVYIVSLLLVGAAVTLAVAYLKKERK